MPRPGVPPYAWAPVNQAHDSGQRRRGGGFMRDGKVKHDPLRHLKRS
jgi:hypothetical protein